MPHLNKHSQQLPEQLQNKLECHILQIEIEKEILAENIIDNAQKNILNHSVTC